MKPRALYADFFLTIKEGPAFFSQYVRGPNNSEKKNSFCPPISYTKEPKSSKEYNLSLTLIFPGGGGPNHHPQLENRDYYETEHPLDLRPVCKLEFVHCGQVKKKNSSRT